MIRRLDPSASSAGSLFRAGVASRLLVALILSALLWAAILWASA